MVDDDVLQRTADILDAAAWVLATAAEKHRTGNGEITRAQRAERPEPPGGLRGVQDP